MSPARQESPATLDLIRAQGFDICLDWETDCRPLPMRTESGDIIAVPILNELDDRAILSTKHHDEAMWRDQLLEAVAMTADEAQSLGGRSIGFTLTPYIIGQPFRIWALREMLGALSDNADVWTASVSAIADASKP